MEVVSCAGRDSAEAIYDGRAIHKMVEAMNTAKSLNPRLKNWSRKISDREALISSKTRLNWPSSKTYSTLFCRHRKERYVLVRTLSDPEVGCGLAPVWIQKRSAE